MAMTRDLVEDSFNSAKKAFQESLADPNLYNEILSTSTIADVYKLTAKLQEDAASQKGLRHLARFRPFLERLSAYAGVVDTFIQVKPDLLALIWGPIRLILLWSSQLNQALDAIADVTAKIAQALPQFASMAQIFAGNDTVKAVLGVFYQDILDFYIIVLKFFRMSRWKYMFEAIWPNQKKKIDVVVSNLDKHAHLMRDEVTLLDIKEAQEARVLALAHFTETHEFQDAQKFQGLKARISPSLYDERLDWLSNRSHPDGAKWLLRDQTFIDWLDVSKRDTTWLWLQGIPGSGKTYLAAAAISHAKKNHQTIFIFASHTNQKSLTALSVLQSLIFQVVVDNKNLQTVLVESNERDLKSNTSHATDLVKSLLASAGPIYIVIDGLDEMEESERQILLQKLDTVLQDCKELKILIGSRAEDNITQALGKKAKSIRVDQRNSGSIQGYINTRSREWMDNCSFDVGTESEVIRLLSPLSASAKGMFLYARIVLDNLEQLHGIDEVRQELKALPTDLTDAYQRIFQRINDSRPQTRDKCRKILAWIGCAPVPLTTFELEQALLVDDSTEDAPSVAIAVNFVRMCGPIIEIVNERPQFVHFTAQEYIFDTEIKGYIDTERANHDMAITSLSYLYSRALDPELSNSDLEMNLISGRYRLLGYLAFHWPAITLRYARKIGWSWIDLRFSELLTRVALEARNYEFESDTDSPENAFQNEYLQENSPEGYEMLCAEFQFRLDERSADWNLSNSETWVNFDPLTTSQILVRVQEHFDTLLCGQQRHGAGCNEKCAGLQRHYGSHLYKCTYPYCSYSRLGFESRSDREKHVKHHGRPWKCSVAACEWSVIGFNTKKNRDHHWLRFHQTAVQTQTEEFNGLDLDEIQPLLFGLVKDGDVDGVQTLLASSGGASLGLEILTAAMIIAVQQGSLPIAQLLIPKDEKYIPANLVIVAVEGQDADIVKWALSKSDPDDVAKFLKSILDTRSDQVYSLWEEHLVTIPQYRMGKNFPDEVDRLDVVFKQPVFSEVKDNPMKEARLKHTWRFLSKNLKRDSFSAALIRITKSTCSIPLAKELIELGADVDYPTDDRYHNGMTALRLASKKTSKEAALFMQFLLSEGADPYEMRRGSLFKIGDERGAKEISKWLGITWDELVKSNIEHIRKRYAMK